MGNEHSKQLEQGKSSTYSLVGNEHFTKEERSEFLAQARRQEERYDEYIARKKTGSAELYPHEYLPDMDAAEHKFTYPDFPKYLQRGIRVDTWSAERLTEMLQDPAFSERQRDKFEKKLQQAQERLIENNAKLEAYYRENPHKRLQENVVDDAGVRHAETPEIGKSQAWHKQRVDPKQPLKFTEAFERANAILGNRDYRSPEFKPYEGDPRQGMEALYTSVNENAHVRTPHKDIHLNPYQQPLAESHIKHASKYTLLAMGLLGATEAAKADPGDLSSKLDAAKHVLKITLAEAIPGVTFMEKMHAGKYQQAGLDAASYLPLGDMTAFTRSPEVQGVIDNLPKSTAQLQAMLSDESEAPINRHMAEYQLRFIEAKQSGELLKGLNALGRLTELAEQKIIYQMQWSKNSSDYAKAVQTPDPDWSAIMKHNPEIAPQIAIHATAVNSGRPREFVEQMDANITGALAQGRLLPSTLSIEQPERSH